MHITYAYVYVYVYIYIYIYMYTYIYTHLYTYVYIYIYTHFYDICRPSADRGSEGLLTPGRAQARSTVGFIISIFEFSI